MKKTLFLFIPIVLILLSFNVEDDPWGEIKKFPSILPDFSHKLGIYCNNEPWTMEKVLRHSLWAMENEAPKYGDYCFSQGERVAISYGLMIGMGNYGEDFMTNNNGGWSYFKNNTIYAIVKDENLLQTAYDFVKPYYQKCFESLSIIWQDVYVRSAIYLKNHMDNFDYQATEKFMREHEADFAYKEIDGSRSPFRKLSAMIDRWIIKHKIISVERAKKWVDIITAEIISWKKFSAEDLQNEFIAQDIEIIRSRERGQSVLTSLFLLNPNNGVVVPPYPQKLNKKYTAKGTAYNAYEYQKPATLISESNEKTISGAKVFDSYHLSLIIENDTFPGYLLDVERVREDTIVVKLLSFRNDFYEARFIKQEIEGPQISYMKRVKPGIRINYSERKWPGETMLDQTEITSINFSGWENYADAKTFEMTNKKGEKITLCPGNPKNPDYNLFYDVEKIMELSKNFFVELSIIYDPKEEIIELKYQYFKDYIGLLFFEKKARYFQRKSS